LRTVEKWGPFNPEVVQNRGQKRLPNNTGGVLGYAYRKKYCRTKKIKRTLGPRIEKGGRRCNCYTGFNMQD